MRSVSRDKEADKKRGLLHLPRTLLVETNNVNKECEEALHRFVFVTHRTRNANPQELKDESVLNGRLALNRRLYKLRLCLMAVSETQPTCACQLVNWWPAEPPPQLQFQSN